MAGRGRGRGGNLPEKFAEESKPGLTPTEEETFHETTERGEQVLRKPIGRGRGITKPYFPSANPTSGIDSSLSDSSVATTEIPIELQVHDQPHITSRGRGLSGRGGPQAESRRAPTFQPRLGSPSESEAQKESGDRHVLPGDMSTEDRSRFADSLSESLPDQLSLKESKDKPSSKSVVKTSKEGGISGGPPSETFFGAGPRSVGSLGSGMQEEVISEEVLEVEPAAPIVPMIRMGTKGTSVPITTNFLKMRVTPTKGLFDYIVTFDPIIDGMTVRRTAIRQLEETLGKTRTFDGSHLFLPFKMEQDVIVLQTNHPTDPDTTLSVTIKYTRQLDIRDSVYFYNILLRRAMDLLGYVEMSHKYFDPTRMINMPENKMEIWPGLTTAVQEYEGGLMLCVDAAHRILRQTTVYDFLSSHKQEPNIKEKLYEYVVGRTVLTRYNNKTYKIDDVAWHLNPTKTFNRKGTEVTYATYFSEHHRVRILDLKQPLIVSKVKPRKNDPMGEERLIMLVPETCYVTGFSEEITSNHVIMRTIMGHTAIAPAQRLIDLKRFVDSLKGNADVRNIFTEWGLEICPRTTEVAGRIMKGPTLYFSERFSLKDAGADFSREATTNHCFNPINLKKWVIFCQIQDKDKASSLLRTYRQVCPALGIRMANDAEIIVVKSTGRYPGPNDFKKIIRERGQPTDVQFLVVILPQARDDLYAAVKRQCLVDTSIPSQVILSKTLSNEKRLRSVMQKVALQINCKLGGSLWALNIPVTSLTLEKIMFVGVDTHHDPKRKNKSVMAMVATLDTRCTQYYSRVSFQTAHQEMAEALKSLYSQALAAFFEENHAWPDRVVVFRDGISDGQLQFVMEHEVKPIKSVTMLMCKTEIKFSYVVVQKRINERFFCAERGRHENPHPGTVVDHTITRRTLYDFFLVSQLVRQGTVTPSHYIVLDDSNENNPDLMQRFSFVLAFMYFNWPGSIRGPAVCQYAHKLAMLVGQHLNTEPMCEMEKKLYYL